MLVTLLMGLAAVLAWASRVHLQLVRNANQLRESLHEVTLSKQAAEGQNLAKNDFLAKLSQEIRTPMNGIVSSTELVLRTELTSEQRNHLEAVLETAEWLTRWVSDVLDFTHMESTSNEEEAHEFPVSQCIDSAVNMVRPQATEKNLSITMKIDPALPSFLCGDSVRIRHVLFNLLENAVRFTTAGSIRVSVSVREQTLDDLVLVIAVADTGVGIPLERQKSIFEPFQSGTCPDQSIFRGGGLGLSICKRLVEKMGGNIEVQSQIGAGSTFVFTARVRRAPNPEERTERLEILQRFSARRLSILLAGAEVQDRRFLAKLLESAGHQVTPAASGTEVLAMFSTDIFDLILLDTEMPDLDTRAVTDTLRNLECDVAHTPIYAFVPHSGQTVENARFLPALDGVIQKPVQVEELLKTVNEIANLAQMQPVYSL